MKYKNSSGAEVYLGHFEGHDLYWDGQSGLMPTVIARYGDEPHEYMSGLGLASMNPYLRKARELALALGLDCGP